MPIQYTLDQIYFLCAEGFVTSLWDYWEVVQILSDGTERKNIKSLGGRPWKVILERWSLPVSACWPSWGKKPLLPCAPSLLQKQKAMGQISPGLKPPTVIQKNLAFLEVNYSIYFVTVPNSQDNSPMLSFQGLHSFSIEIFLSILQTNKQKNDST